VSFSTILDVLVDIFKGENEAFKFERDLALRGVEFEYLHVELKPSSESLNLIFFLSFFWCYALFYYFKFLSLALKNM
jgi:hypothetical protein